MQREWWDFGNKGLFVSIGAFLLGSYALTSNFSHSAMIEKHFDAMDSSPSDIFNSISDCQDKGYNPKACEESYAEAKRLSNAYRIRQLYETDEACEVQHGLCDQKEITELVTVMKGFTREKHSTRYSPPMVAWQVGIGENKINTRMVAPLYQGKDKNTLVRSDKKTFGVYVSLAK